MRLGNWIRQEMTRTGVGKEGVVDKICTAAGVSRTAVLDCVSKRKMIGLFLTAKRISKTTKGKVTIAELCE